jgi:PAS domain S-box-containing protein
MSKKVLIVDNHPMMLSFLEEVVSQEGYAVRTAGDGVSALTELHTDRPDILITDLVMPNIDGRKLCRIVRAIPEYRDIVVIVLSAIAREEPEDPERIGADVYIAKGPLDKMKGHVLEALARAPSASTHQPDVPEIIGIGDVYAREITIELLSLQRHAIAVLEHMSDAILTVNRDGRIVFANRRALLLTGKAEEQVLGRPISEMPIQDAETGEPVLSVENLSDLDTARIYAVRNTVVRITVVSLRDNLQDVWVLMLKDETQQLRYEQELKAALAEKDLLLRELQHRVSNNLATIASMVNLQRSHMEDDSCRESLGKLHAHVESIMLVHEQLRAAGGVGGIELHAFLPSLVDNVVTAADPVGRITAQTEVDPGELSVKKAIPLGMIIAELVTNSVNHAYAPEESGVVSVSLSQSGPDSLSLVVRDDGSGSADTARVDGDRLGLTIVETLTDQLDGDIEFDWSNGTRCTLTFPRDSV